MPVRTLLLIILFLLGLLLGTSPLLAQSVPLRVTVRNAQTKQPLAYATVYSAKLKTGQYTTEAGLLEWTLSASDTLTVSFLSFQAQTIPVRSLLNTGEVLLNEAAYELGTVEVKARKKRPRTFRIGFYDDPTDFDGWGTSIGFILVNNIYNNTQQVGRLKTFLVDLGRAKKQPHRALARLRVFAADKGVRGPGRDLLTENIIFKIPRFATHLKIDLSQYNITFPLEGLFVGLEFLGFESKDGLKNSWKSQTGANVTSTRRDDYQSVGESWRFRDTYGRPRWICLSDASQHKAWERTLLKIGADVEAVD